ncbi:MAG: protease complex subunit PrcB family protein [Rhodospirillaceae bacterium]|nr:protease complex subunit PrcB family protein [Rhodospirillaceae bacterium]
MRQAIHALTLATAWLVLASCSGSQSGDTAMAEPMGDTPQVAQAVPLSGPVPRIDDRFTWSGQQSAAFNDLFVTAREERGWRLLWQLVGEDPPGPLPDEAMAVAVFLGARPTAGYQVAITDVLESPGEITVQYRETEPSAGATTAQILTAPYVVELVPLSSLPVNFETDG